MSVPGGWGVLLNMGYRGMCRCEGYGFQEVVYSGIGYKIRAFGSRVGYHFARNFGKPGIVTQKSASLSFHDSASTELIDDYHKTLLDIINCRKSVSGKQLV